MTAETTKTTAAERAPATQHHDHEHDDCGCGHDHHHHGHSHAHHHAPLAPFVRAAAKVGRNDACPCGSGRKYKKCCLAA